MQFIYCLLFLVCNLVEGLPDDFSQAVSCYGNTHNELIEPSCLFGKVIAVRNMWATSKLKDTGCPQSIRDGITYNASCCQIDTSVDCKLEFDKTKRDPYLECTGKIECSVGTDWQQMLHTCGSRYLQNSNIQSMDYNCIASADIMTFERAAEKKSIDETYIFNNGFPSKMTSSSGGTCHVTSCSTGIKIGLIDARFSNTSGVCGQKLTIKDGAATTDVGCESNNKLTWTIVYTSTTSSVYITLTVTSASPAAYIWIDVGGNNMDAYCGVTDTYTPPSGPVCTTTSTSTTTTTNTASTPTTTEKATTTSANPSSFTSSDPSISTRSSSVVSTSSTEAQGGGITSQSRESNQDTAKAAIGLSALAFFAVVVLAFFTRSKISEDVHKCINRRNKKEVAPAPPVRETKGGPDTEPQQANVQSTSNLLEKQKHNAEPQYSNVPPPSSSLTSTRKKNKRKKKKTKETSDDDIPVSEEHVDFMRQYEEGASGIYSKTDETSA